MSGSLEVRAAGIDDADGIAAIYAPMVTSTAISFEEVPPDADEIVRRMTVRPYLPWLVGDRGTGVVGFAYASAHRSRPGYRWAVDVSIYLDPTETGRGTGRLLYEQLFTDLRELGHVQAFAGIALPNTASVGLHEALGFELVGVYRQVGFKHGRWHNVGWWQKSLRDLPPRPDEPREWDPLLTRASRLEQGHQQT